MLMLWPKYTAPVGLQFGHSSLDYPYRVLPIYSIKLTDMYDASRLRLQQ